MNFDITKKFKIYFDQFITKKEEDNEKKNLFKRFSNSNKK